VLNPVSNMLSFSCFTNRKLYFQQTHKRKINQLLQPPHHITLTTFDSNWVNTY